MQSTTHSARLRRPTTFIGLPLTTFIGLPLTTFVVGAIALALTTIATATTEIYYSFSDGRVGGVALLAVDGVDEPKAHRRIVEIPNLERPRKLAISDDGSALLLVDETSRSGNLILVELDGETPRVTRLDFPTVPDEVRAVRGGFVVGGDRGNLVFVDATRRAVAATWTSRGTLTPSGHKPEDIAVLPGGERIILSFQKDSSSGRHLGSRLVTMDIPSLRVVADLQLPRDRPELHIAGNIKEQGPNPEVIVLSPKTNTLFLTLDLYGGLLMADLDAVMEGRLVRPVTVSADPAGAWGVAFPDRVVHFDAGGRETVVVANAGESGGVVAVDLGTRRRVAAAETISGLDTLVHLKRANVVAAAPAGKVKRRVAAEVEKSSEPQRELHLIDVSRLHGGELPVVLHSMDDLTTHLAAVGDESSDEVVVVLGRGQTHRLALLTIVRDADGTFDVTERWSVPVEGELRRLISRR